MPRTPYAVVESKSLVSLWNVVMFFQCFHLRMNEPRAAKTTTSEATKRDAIRLPASSSGDSECNRDALYFHEPLPQGRRAHAMSEKLDTQNGRGPLRGNERRKTLQRLAKKEDSRYLGLKLGTASEQRRATSCNSEQPHARSSAI